MTTRNASPSVYHRTWSVLWLAATFGVAYGIFGFVLRAMEPRTGLGITLAFMASFAWTAAVLFSVRHARRTSARDKHPR